jgi:hypothetical protein
MKNDSHWADLKALRHDLERVDRDLRFLRVKADQLEQRLDRETIEPFEQAASAELAPPVIAEFMAPQPRTEILVAPVASSPVIPEERLENYSASTVNAHAEEPKAPVPPAPEKPAREPESFEMRLGSYWFVRIGIVMVLTAMVFLGNYAYQHYIPRFGPWGKVVMMYLASGGLLAAGKFLPRKHDRLKNYGQVLFGGGLAAVYFTTYAAHHFPNLQIITSALLSGSLLLAWTAFIVWMADRNKSEALAVFAIGLAYYTALITNVGSFTLVSNLTLASAAVFFLVRNRWVGLTFLSVAASYGSYFYWRYYAGSSMGDDSTNRLAIGGYWTIFSAAIFLSRNPEFAGRRRASFLSLNNGAAFSLLTASFYQAHTGNFWMLALGCGAVLLALAALARKLIQDDPLPRRAYFAQGLLLVTLGLITKLSGPTLALVLAVESAWLLIFALQWNSRLTRAASILTSLLATVALVTTLNTSDSQAWWKAAGVAGLLLFNAAWIGRRSEETANARPLPIYFAALALFSWSMSALQLSRPEWTGAILAVTGLALTAIHARLRVREITILAQLVVFAGIAHGFLRLVAHYDSAPANSCALVAIPLALAVWWKRQQSLALPMNARQTMEIAYAVAGAAVMYVWSHQFAPMSNWIYLAVALSAVWLGLGAATRSWPIAGAGQLFIIGAYLQSLFAIANGRAPEALSVIGLIAAFVGFAAIARLDYGKSSATPVLGIVSHVYQSAAALLAMVSVFTYLETPQHFIALSILFALSIAPTLLRGVRYTFFPGVALAVVGLGYWTINPAAATSDMQNLVAILFLGAGQIALRKKPGLDLISESAHRGWIAAIAGALWIYVSRYVIAEASGAHFYLTASWAGLAFLLFGVGFALRERAYRWASLTVLGCALVRVVLLDVWKLETIYRILSFLALGIVLLALGYIYTRFQERIARWL